MLTSILAICLGASSGALLRWGFNSALNALFPALPLGTLVANWLGCLLMGTFVSLFDAFPEINQGWRLLLITGFLGSLTTFSAFSGEIGKLIGADRLALAAGGILLHVAGGIFMFFIGMWIFGQLKKIF